jgi:hypothetical protein
MEVERRVQNSRPSRGTPAAFVGIVYAENEESALAAAIEQHGIRPAIRSGSLRGRGDMARAGGPFHSLFCASSLSKCASPD